MNIFHTHCCLLFSLLIAIPTGINGSSCTCGIKQNERIVGGKPASANEYPWIANLQLSNGDGHFCGGSIIHGKWILSAAHCFADDTSKADAVNVVVGFNDMNYVDPEEMREVTRIINHPNYDKNTFDNDIALLELSEEITFAKGKLPVCLPFALKVAEVAGQTLHTIGWGKLKEDGEATEVLQELDLPILSTAQCSEYIKEGLTDNMFCTYKPGYDTCQGDSGGPTTYEKNGKHIQLGIVSSGTGCARVNSPGIYTKLQNYVQWIKDVTEVSFCGDPSDAAREANSPNGLRSLISGVF